MTGQLAPVIERIIKRNTDFGKYPGSRRLVESYLKALSRLDKHSRRAVGQSPRKRARSRSAERCLDLDGHHQYARNHKTGSSLSVMTSYQPPTIQEQCAAEQGYQTTSSLSVYNPTAISAPPTDFSQKRDRAQTPSPSHSNREKFQEDLNCQQGEQDRVLEVSSTGSIINVELVPDPSPENSTNNGPVGGPTVETCQQRLEVPTALEDEVFREEPVSTVSSLKVTSRTRSGCAVEAFTRQMHGDSSACPHPRILPNLVAVCLSAIYRAFSQK